VSEPCRHSTFRNRRCTALNYHVRQVFAVYVRAVVGQADLPPDSLHQPQVGTSTDLVEWAHDVVDAGLEDRPDPACRAACGVRSGALAFSTGSPCITVRGRILDLFTNLFAFRVRLGGTDSHTLVVEGLSVIYRLARAFVVRHCVPSTRSSSATHGDRTVRIGACTAHRVPASRSHP
jgi:hypothetical protein